MTKRSVTATLAVQGQIRELHRGWVLDRKFRLDYVDTPHGKQIGWLAHEWDLMHHYVNRIRIERGMPPATLEQVVRIDESAAGHSDYVHKLTLRLAELALEEDEPGAVP